MRSRRSAAVDTLGDGMHPTTLSRFRIQAGRFWFGPSAVVGDQAIGFLTVCSSLSRCSSLASQGSIKTGALQSFITPTRCSRQICFKIASTSSRLGRSMGLMPSSSISTGHALVMGRKTSRSKCFSDSLACGNISVTKLLLMSLVLQFAVCSLQSIESIQSNQLATDQK